jgi:CRISPR-associated protein Cas2
MFIVIAYDVVSDQRRNKVFKTLKNHGRHVQYSVFECDLRRQDYRRLRSRLEDLIDPAEDNIRFYFLAQDAVALIEHIGVERGLSPQHNATILIL